ncbi:MAG: hypothetical protein QGG40_21585, partial [Myxococcota bacterium]|nr:hypothetical protein [Myxococcota bacterium]
AVGAALAVSRNLEEHGVTDKSIHERLLRDALFGDEQQRKEAVLRSRDAARVENLALSSSESSGSSATFSIQLSTQNLSALQRYTALRLSVQSEPSVYGSAFAPHRTYPAPQAPYWWISDSRDLESNNSPIRWSIYRGLARLSVPDFLETTGQSQQLNSVNRDIDTARKKSKVWFAAAGLGASALTGSLAAMASAQDYDTYVSWNRLALGGAAISGLGLLAASFPATEAAHLNRFPETVMNIEEAQQLVEAHNSSLREELDLTADQVLVVELGANPLQ